MGERALEAFEWAVTNRMSDLSGTTMGGVGVSGSRRNPPRGRIRIVRQPWFGPACRAARARWRAAVHRGDPPELIASARMTYRATLRRSKTDFAWHIDRYRVHHERSFWRLLRSEPPAVTASMADLYAHF